MFEQPDKWDQQVFKRILALNSDIQKYLDLAPTLKLQRKATDAEKTLRIGYIAPPNQKASESHI